MSTPKRAKEEFLLGWDVGYVACTEITIVKPLFCSPTKNTHTQGDNEKVYYASSKNITRFLDRFNEKLLIVPCGFLKQN